ncbi:MAG: hypothetical protein ACJ74Z_17650 [Bryobacteraceae bacterium]
MKHMCYDVICCAARLASRLPHLSSYAGMDEVTYVSRDTSDRFQITRRLVLALSLFVTQAFGTTNYISLSASSNVNRGTSKSSLWKTIAEFGPSVLRGEFVLFKSGDRSMGSNFRRALTTPSVGTSGTSADPANSDALLRANVSANRTEIANYVPYWLGASAFRTSGLFQDSGSNGVGTIANAAKLDVTSATPFIAVRGYNNATLGRTVGVLGQVTSEAGTAGIFDNAGGGLILSGLNNGVQKFSVDGAGKVTADSISANSVNASSMKVSNINDAVTGSSDSGEGIVGNQMGGSTAAAVHGIAWTSHPIAGVLADGGNTTALLARNLGGPECCPAVTAELYSTKDEGALLNAHTSSGASCVIDLSGNFRCTGTKSAVVKVAALNSSGAVDGATPELKEVALYAMESPENWFEDFGTARLVSGAGWVNLDAVFAETVNSTVDYRVFLTPNQDCNGLYVAKKTPSSFEVREIGSGRSNVKFDYRIVARRKGYEKVRLEDVTDKMKAIRLTTASR